MLADPDKSTGAKRARIGYTLVELMVALAVFGLAMLGTLGFFLQGLNLYHYDGGKLQVNRDIRTFTSEMSDNATYANYFLIYPSFTDRTGPINDGLAGDFLVLVFLDPANPQRIQRLVGYYRSPDNPGDPNSTGPVRKFDFSYSPSTTTLPASLLPPVANISDYDEVIEVSRGLSNGKLFYNFYDRSIMVKGEVIHRGTTARRATNTYNFTVSPRG